jgi:site-specific DNA recombinase
MENNKKTAIYARTGSKKQNIELQIEAAIPYIKGIDPENVVYFIDEGVSISSQPKGLHKLLDLIAKDQIQTLITYERDRLTRNFYEYLKLVNLINFHNTKVVFTATGNNVSLGNIYSEGVYALVNNIERIEMSNRIKSSLIGKQS